jgi:protein YibB
LRPVEAKMITIVTAFFDIGRGDWAKFTRTVDTYFCNFERLCLLENPIILFTESKHRGRVEKILTRKSNLVVYYDDDLFERHASLLSQIRKVQQDPRYKEGILDAQCPEYFEPKYVLVNYLKASFCEKAIQQQAISSTLVAWLDFGYLKKKRQLPVSLRWDYPFEEKIHMYSLLPVDGPVNITQIVKENIVYIQGCHIIAPAHQWRRMAQLMADAMQNQFDQGLIDDDQSMLLMAYLASPADFVIHPADVNTRLGNFFIFKKFNVFEENLSLTDRLTYLYRRLWIS